jgi:hypothetical protein
MENPLGYIDLVFPNNIFARSVLRLPTERSWVEDQEAQKMHGTGRRARSTDSVSILSIPERLQYFKWNWFTVVMATGGIADSIHSSEYNPFAVILSPDNNKLTISSLSLHRTRNHWENLLDIQHSSVSPQRHHDISTFQLSPGLF